MNLIQIIGKRVIRKMGVTVKQLVYSFHPRKERRTTRNNMTGCHRSGMPTPRHRRPRESELHLDTVSGSRHHGPYHGCYTRHSIKNYIQDGL